MDGLLAGGTPILALDMYEHSYHLDFGAKAASYVDTFMAPFVGAMPTNSTQSWQPARDRGGLKMYERVIAVGSDPGS